MTYHLVPGAPCFEPTKRKGRSSRAEVANPYKIDEPSFETPKYLVRPPEAQETERGKILQERDAFVLLSEITIIGLCDQLALAISSKDKTRSKELLDELSKRAAL